ncbi:phosphoesterase [Paludibacter sp. 221]|uniref:FN3 domain-containing metallophosphoesterase family protein n=1 Tax=Paludibacter sp. 221 TaxID=2302939 RepID=UPI0013D48B99|nr:FN3 domain-containing metallophosphoesterase family protein [Paludibacter sp. 221]NDV47290.1 phosphoesterase [Paludibacter sp. 221]
MKKTNLHFIFTFLFLTIFSSGYSFAQDSYNFNHGPYLQGLTEKEVSIYFTTSAKGFSHIELRNGENGDITKHYTYVNGLVQANNTMNTIKIDGLEPDTKYEYRLISKEMTDFQPYKVTYGDSISSEWYQFKTFNPKAKSASFIATSDIHDDAKKYSDLLSYLPVDKAEIVFLLGDIMSYFHKPDQPYTSFIDVSVDKFATEKPFVIVRGNHETRGHLAREYDNFVYRQDGHYYGVYTLGNTVVVMLDSGEDKPDTHPVYAGITAFDQYRAEQVEWLKEVVKSKEYKSAKHRIVMVHIPPLSKNRKNQAEKIQRDTDHGTQQMNDLFMPILNKAKVDLMISGHTHRHFILEEEKGVNNFPILVNDNKSASFVTVDDNGIHVKTVNNKGETTLERTF